VVVRLSRPLPAHEVRSADPDAYAGIGTGVGQCRVVDGSQEERSSLPRSGQPQPDTMQHRPRDQLPHAAPAAATTWFLWRRTEKVPAALLGGLALWWLLTTVLTP
jgi:hypothetical protein